MKIKLGKILNKKMCSLLLIGTITACALVAPSVRNNTNNDVVKGNYSDEDVKNNREMIMMIISKDKKQKNKNNNKHKNKVKSR